MNHRDQEAAGIGANSGGSLGRMIRRTVVLGVPGLGLRDSASVLAKVAKSTFLVTFMPSAGGVPGGYVLDDQHQVLNRADHFALVHARDQTSQERAEMDVGRDARLELRQACRLGSIGAD